MTNKTIALAVLIAVFAVLVIIDGKRKLKRKNDESEN